MTDTDPYTEELQAMVDNMEANRDPDDNEFEHYARICNRVAGDEEAAISKCDREVAKLIANRDKIIAGCNQRRQGIEWKWGQMMREKVAARIKGTRQRFVDTLFGRLGFRKQAAKQKRTYKEGFGKDDAVVWAKVNAPDIVSKKESVNINDMPADFEKMWIDTLPATDVFYWKPNKEKTDGE